jgi:hypothetical protein
MSAIREVTLLGILLLLYSVFLGAYFIPIVDNVDSHGYMVSARLFQEHGRFCQVPQDDYSFVGPMWVANAKGEQYAKYPPLFPSLAGLIMRAFGVDAGFYVVPILALLGVLGMYALCRTRFSGYYSLLGAFVLAVTPVFNVLAFRQMSHSVSMCFLVWGYLLFLLAIGRETSRSRTALALGAGFLLGYAVGIRYTNALLVIPPLLLGVAKQEGSRARLIGAYLAGLGIPVAFLAAYHRVAFGGVLRTGYALSGEQTAFGWGYLVTNMQRFGTWVVTELLGPLFVFSCIGAVVLWVRTRTRAMIVATGTLPLFLLYMSYYWCPDLFPAAFLRFLLPLLVPATVLALVGLEWVSHRLESQRAARLLSIIVFIGSIGWWGVWNTLVAVERDYRRHLARKSVVDFVVDAVPESSVIFGHPVLLQSLDINQAYNLYPYVILDKDRIHDSLVDPDKPFAIALQDERAELIKRDFCGADKSVYTSRVRSLLQSALSEGRAVFVVGNPSVVARCVWSLPSGITYQDVAEETWIKPTGKLLSPDWPAGVDRSGRAPSKRTSYRLVRIAHNNSPGS